MNWAILVVAGIFEVGWAIGLKCTEGFSRLWPTVWTVFSMIISLGLLGIAMKTLPVGRRGSYRHRNIRDCATWRAHERGSDDQRGAHTGRHCRP
jgi:hypothetical protein